MYRKIATAIMTALVLGAASSVAVSKPRPAQTISAAEQAWFDRASQQSTM